MSSRTHAIKKLKIELHPVLKTLAKASFVFLLLYFLFKKGFLSVEVTTQALRKWDLVLPAILTSALSIGLGIVRWQLLLRAQSIQLSWRRVAELTLVGNFFNIALPGAVSGDFVKAVYVGKDTHSHKSKAFGSILFDRVAGLSALVIVSAGALLFGLESFLHSTVLAGIGLLLSIAAAVVITFFAYLFLVKERHDPLLKLLRWLETRVTQFQAITKIYEGIRFYHNHRWTVVQVLLVSVMIHLLVGFGGFQLARAVDGSSFSLLSIYLIVPLGLLVTAIPVAPGGVGTGNIAFLYLFHLLGSERGGDVYSLMALINISYGALGGLVYLRLKKSS